MVPLNISRNFVKKDRQFYKQNSRCCKNSLLSYGKMTLSPIKIISVFLMNRKQLRSFSHFQILTRIAYSDLSRNLQKLTNFEVCLHTLQN